MSNSLRIIIAFILAIVLAVILTPFCGSWFEDLFGIISVGFWGPAHPEYIPGFIVAYMFSLPLFIVSLLEKRRIIWLLIGIFPVLAVGLGELNGGGIIMSLIAFTIGTLLGLLADKLSRIGEKE